MACVTALVEYCTLINKIMSFRVHVSYKKYKNKTKYSDLRNKTMEF